MEIIRNGLELVLKNGADTILESTKSNPMIYVGYGKETVDMYRGNFKIEDYVIERRPLEITEITETESGLVLEMGDAMTVNVLLDGDCVTLNFTQKDEKINRFWFRVKADAAEHCYGCGEQMSYLDLRGRHFPIWTGEPGVGRDKTTYVTWRSDVENGGAGGDYWNTNYPQPTFVSSKRYYVDVDSTAYADFDFRNADFHELQVWSVPAYIRIEAAPTFVELLEKLTAYFGRQPELPDWVYNGLIVGVQGGNERSFGLVDKSIDRGIKVAAVWCQDWCGKRITSFGKRLQWDWRFHEEMYPNLPGEIEKLHNRGIKFMGYINPYLVEGGKLYQEGLEKGVFATKADGSVYLVDFGEFYCGVIDFTKPEAYQWFKDEVIKKYSINIGIDGWMADFGEYLPTDDLVLANGVSPMIEHNHWPALWAKCNYDAVTESGKLGEIVYFMRAGATGSQKYCTLLWNGDQSVDFSRHDGLCTTICGTLGAGMIGCGLNHSDIGGYTSLFDNCRTRELFIRWAESAVFTPVMRTHEGNRPDTNFQYYDDESCMEELARLVDIHVMMTPYIKKLVAENAAKGTPVQRPLFLHNEQDERSYVEQFEYLFGEDILVAPVWQEGKSEWECYLPSNGWVHLWTGKEYGHGTCVVPAALGDTPVFYKKGSEVAAIMEEIRAKYAK